MHFACGGNSILSLDVVQELVKAYPESILQKTRYGHQMPLHIACNWGKSLEIVQFFVKRAPGTVLVCDNEGKTPLDMAKRPMWSSDRAAKPDVVSYLEQMTRHERLREKAKKLVEGDDEQTDDDIIAFRSRLALHALASHPVVRRSADLTYMLVSNFPEQVIEANTEAKKKKKKRRAASSGPAASVAAHITGTNTSPRKKKMRMTES